MRTILLLCFILVSTQALAFSGRIREYYVFDGMFCNQTKGAEYLATQAEWNGKFAEDVAIPPSCTYAWEVYAEYLGIEQVVMVGNSRYEILRVRIHQLQPSFITRLFEFPLEQFVLVHDKNYVGV